ncbi:ervatamin-B [Selaginella moellendorffii]|uniref:ervatamin-B n=1 Tax=Selaginella moellendorffii TaxID=88036 RepID=UPI000D1C74EB|nr:ervatamin-B [Selaginella moellendorffii]|eukprot:XP_024529138.1 ervatamin-B [Selaginella moellendorffii]
MHWKVSVASSNTPDKCPHWDESYCHEEIKKTHLDNLKFIQAENQKQNDYVLEANKFAYLTNAEFRERFLTTITPREPFGSFSHSAAESLPEVVDWRTRGAEARWSSLPPQQPKVPMPLRRKCLFEEAFFKCSKNDLGHYDKAFEFIIENGGIDSEGDFTIDGYEHVLPNNEEALKKAVAHQPVSVMIDAGCPAFKFYKSGILTSSCGTDLNHAVTIVGYGITSDGKKYWIVKNSWGTEWGDDGYVYMQRDTGVSTGLCGINMNPSYPTKQGLPKIQDEGLSTSNAANINADLWPVSGLYFSRLEE